MGAVQNLKNEIEGWVQTRQIDKVRYAIPIYLKAQDHSEEARLDAAEWYRRIVDLNAALAVLKIEVSAKGIHSLSQSQVQSQIQLARILNLLGASCYALRIARLVRSHPLAQSASEAGGIFLSNYCFAEAKACLQKFADVDATQLGYVEKFRSVAYADALVSTGEYEPALQIYRRILETSAEPLLRGIVSQAMGAAHARAGQLALAYRHLNDAQKWFPPNDKTTDRGILEKWLGVYHLKAKQYDLAAVHLKSAFRLLFRPGYKPEAWLEVVYWKGLLNLLRSPRKFPNDWYRLLAFPAVNQEFANRIATTCEIPAHFILSPRARISTAKPFHVDMESETVHSKRFQSIGIDLQSKLLALLTYAGSCGIPQYRLAEVLWPETLFSVSHQQKRLDQVVYRLRKSHWNLRWSQQHLWVEKDSACSAYWSKLPPIRGKSFLIEHPQFLRSDVEKKFRLSRRSANYQCQEWLKAGLVKRSREGLYQVVLKS